MKKFLSFLVLSAFLAFGSLSWAADSDTQDVYCELKPITVFSVSGNPGPLIIDQANPSEDPQPVTDSSTTYSFSNNVPGKKIVGKINSAMPQYTKLEINLNAPPDATSLGWVELSDTNQNLVTGINRRKGSYTIFYRFSAQIEAEPFSTTKTVTLTMTDN
jgi:hypothetical protein